MANASYVLGFDIGGTKIAVSLVASDGSVLASARLANANRMADDVLPEMVQTACRLVQEAGMNLTDVSAAGVCSPNPIDFDKGLILSPVNLPGWRNVPIIGYLKKELGIPAFFDNDANASVLAEWIFGDIGEMSNVLYVAISTGIGGGIIANSNLVRGENCYAGEFGHVCLDPNGPVCNCGMRGCWEAFCGGGAVEKRLRSQLKGNPSSRICQIAGSPEQIRMKDLADAVREKDAFACQVWDDMMERHAQAVGSLINSFNPHAIVLGTIALRCQDIFMPALLERIPKYSWKQPREICSVFPTKIGEKLEQLAGAAVAFYGIRNMTVQPL